MAMTATQLLSPKICSSSRPQISSCSDRRGESSRLIQRDAPAVPETRTQIVRELISPSRTPTTQLRLQESKAVIRVIWSPVTCAESTVGSRDG